MWVTTVWVPPEIRLVLTGSLIWSPALAAWAQLLMPQEVIAQVAALGQAQCIPGALTFGDRLAHEIPDGLADFDVWPDNNNNSYDPALDASNVDDTRLLILANVDAFLDAPGNSGNEVEAKADPYDPYAALDDSNGGVADDAADADSGQNTGRVGANLSDENTGIGGTAKRSTESEHFANAENVGK